MPLAQKPTQSAIHPHLQIEIHYDDNPERPETAPFKISYNSSARTVLGNDPASAERDAEIARKVRDGEYVGWPVWAYVHGNAALKLGYTNPFGCPWDSGRSGWMYCTKKEALEEFGVKAKMLSANRKSELFKQAEYALKVFNEYLNGECYGFVIRNTQTNEALDSSWGYYGSDHVESEAASALAQMEALETKRINEASDAHKQLALTIDFVGEEPQS